MRQLHDNSTIIRKISLLDWTVRSVDHECVILEISEKVSLEDLQFSLIDENRISILKIKVTSHKIEICSHLVRPTFAQLGDSVQYVKNSEL